MTTPKDGKPRCKHVAGIGIRCHRDAEQGSEYCQQHILRGAFLELAQRIENQSAKQAKRNELFPKLVEALEGAATRLNTIDYDEELKEAKTCL